MNDSYSKRGRTNRTDLFNIEYNVLTGVTSSNVTIRNDEHLRQSSNKTPQPSKGIINTLWAGGQNIPKSLVYPM